MLYRVLALKHTASADTYMWLYSAKSHAFVRCLGIVIGPVVAIQLDDTEKQPASVRNFATDCAFYDDDVVISGVEALHLLGRNPPIGNFLTLRECTFSWEGLFRLILLQSKTLSSIRG